MSPRKPTAAARKPTAAERLTKGSPVTQPAAGRTVTGSTRVRPVRVTVDLDPGDYDSLRDFAHQTRMSHSAIMRELIELLNQPSVSQQISKSVDQGAL